MSARLGVAEVAAHNITNPDLLEQCARWLTPLFSDPDPSVREMTTRWCVRLEGTDLNALLDVARAYVETPAHAEHEHALLHALDEATGVSIADLALLAAEVFVDQHGGEINDIRREAALDASTVSKLAFRAYASAESAEFVTRCLDVIDRLLAARVLAVASGAGIAAISRFALDVELEAGTLAVLDVPRWRLTRTIAAITARHVPLTPPAARFLGLLRETLAPREALPPNSKPPVQPTR